MTKTRILLLAGAATAALLACGPAQAVGVGLTRAWVSGHGTDAAGCGAPTNPCRSLQYTHDSIIAAGGEIDILDPAGYGAVTISKSLSIVNDGVGTAGVQQTNAGADAIMISAGATDSVTLRGLNIDGLGIAKDGIGLNAVGDLTVTNCVIRHFAHDGMYLQPTGTMKLAIVGVTAADNTTNGIELSPAGGTGILTGIVDHSYALNNGGSGVAVSAVLAGALAIVTASNSNLSNNGNAGLIAFGSGNGTNSALVFVDQDIADYNTNGYDAEFGGGIEFTRAEAAYDSGNGILIQAEGRGYTFSDNIVESVSGSLSPQGLH